MYPLYDARGNTYFVATPDELRSFVDLPTDATAAALTSAQWAPPAIERVCVDPRSAEFLSNGMLVGPFAAPDGHGLLIVNTDGSLAERSGNGITIFSQFLVDTGREDRSRAFVVRVHHDRSQPLHVTIEPTEQGGAHGFWIDMSVPTFGPDAVEATIHDLAASRLNEREVSRVLTLEEIDSDWIHSQFVSVGNPHCVTFLPSEDALASLDAHAFGLSDALRAIAFSATSGAARGQGRPCRHGVNLQWASVRDDATVAARVFERGEGWTKSSGSSATAVASAARHLGLVTAPTVRVVMPGGVAPVRFGERGQVMLFGEARRT